MFVFLKPIPGMLIRDPATMIHLKPEGELKEMNRYWRGAVRDGDVEEVAAQVPVQVPVVKSVPIKQKAKDKDGE